TLRARALFAASTTKTILARVWLRFLAASEVSPGGCESGRDLSGRTVTAWMGTMIAPSWVSAVMRTSELIPGRTPGGRLSSATFTGKVVTSDSVPGFLMVAF